MLSLPVITPLLWKWCFGNIQGLQWHCAAGSENICVGCSSTRLLFLTWARGAVRVCSSTGLPPRAEAVTAQASLSHKATEQKRVGSELATSVSEDLSLQFSCSCIFPFSLPTQIYLIYPVYPLLLYGFMNTSCAQSTFSLKLKMPEQLDYKPDGRSQHFGED